MDAPIPVRFELDAAATPASAQIIFLSTDINGSPSRRSHSVGEALGLDLPSPGKGLQSDGYEIVSLSQEHTVVWIATAGDGASTAEHVSSRLNKVLRVIGDYLHDRAPSFWIPLLGTGAGQVSSTLSLSIIADAFTNFAEEMPGLDINVSLIPRADLSEAELASLREILEQPFGTIEDKPIKKPPAPKQRPIYSNIDPSDALKAAQEEMYAAGNYLGPIDGILSEDVILSIESYLESEHDVLLENEGPWQTLLQVFPDLPDQMHSAIDAYRRKYEKLEDEYFAAKLAKENNTPPEPPTDLTSGYHSDRPVEDLENDTLGRVAIADAIADNILHVWPEHERTKRPMAVHLSGRWGSGKSTILNFLRHKLETDLRFAPSTSGRVNVDHQKGWVIADFNAWRMQDAGEAWWSLCDSLVDAAQDSMGAPIRAQRLYWRDRLWQRRKLYGPHLFVATILLAIMFFWSAGKTLQNFTSAAPVEVTTTTEALPSSTRTARASTDAEGVTTTVTTVVDTPKPTKEKSLPIWQPLLTLAAFLGGISTLVGYIKGFNKTNAEVAETIRQLQSEPNAELRKRYKRVVDEIGKPVAVFIDDLDRCRADYVVELLQGLQTTFSDVPVLYVVAADRDWIVSSYNQQFEGFQDEISKPGQPLGYLFVKKIFQLSVSVPDLAPLQAESLTEELLKPIDAPPPRLPPAAQKRADLEAIEGADNIQELKEVAKTIGVARRSSTVSREIFAKVREEAAQEEIKHALLQYAHLFDANPRAIKRLVNAMTFRTGYALMAGADLSFDLIARFTILDLRFPYTAAYLAQFPGKVIKKARKEGTAKEPSPDDTYFHDEAIDQILTDLTPEDIEAVRSLG